MGFIMDGNILKKYIEEEGVTRVVVPDGVTEIDDEAFAGCEHVEETAMPWGGRIKSVHYDGCEHLTEVILPEGLERIGVDAFMNCGDLTKIIERSAFEGCCSLRELHLPSGLDGIDDNTFFGCESLEELVLPDPIEYVGPNALDYCDGLKRITLGKSFADLEWMPFSNPNLEEITVHPENPYYASENGILYNKDMTTLLCCPSGKQGAVVVPDTVTQIGDAWEFAFWHCTKLTSVQLPAGIRRVGMHSFEGCDILARDSVPADVEWFDDKVDHRT